jgi:protein-disulfide isomerase
MQDKLFEGGASEGVSAFKEYAEDLGLDTEEFNDCLDSDEMAEEVKQDMIDGRAAKIYGTPGFIINGKKLAGSRPFADFKEAIDDALD